MDSTIIELPKGVAIVISCDSSVMIKGKILLAHLLPMEMHDFDVILGMDWLFSHRTHVDCFEKRVIFGDIANPDLVYQGTSLNELLEIISALKA